MNKATRAPLKKRGFLPKRSLDAIDNHKQQQQEANQDQESVRAGRLLKQEDERGLEEPRTKDTEGELQPDEETEEDEQDEGRSQHANTQEQANKRKRRLARNRESARNRRKRKKEMLEELSQRVLTLEQEIEAFRRENTELKRENQILWSSLGPQWHSSLTCASSLSGVARGVSPSVHSHHQDAATVQGLVLSGHPHPYVGGLQKQLQLALMQSRKGGVRLGNPFLCQELQNTTMVRGNSSDGEQIS